MTPASEAAATGLPALGGSCCAVYELDWVRVLLGHSFHPGGEALTRRQFEALSLAPGERLADIGCGTGSSALALGQTADVRITGLDLSLPNVAEARRRSAVDAVCGDAVNLPFADHSFQGLMAECSFSLAPDQPAALAEYHRVLAPGRRLAISDMGLERELPPDLAEVAAPWTCLVGAHSEVAYLRLFKDAGFRALQSTDESEGLFRMIDRIKRQLVLAGAGMALAGGVSLPAFDIGEVRHWLGRIRAAVEDGSIRYRSFILERVQAPLSIK